MSSTKSGLPSRFWSSRAGCHSKSASAILQTRINGGGGFGRPMVSQLREEQQCRSKCYLTQEQDPNDLLKRTGVHSYPKDISRFLCFIQVVQVSARPLVPLQIDLMGSSMCACGVSGHCAEYARVNYFRGIRD